MPNVLVVDDEKSIRVTLKAFLECDGHEVEVAEDAAEAEQQLRTGDFDIVLSDIVLPRVTGVELLRMIRKAAPRVQVIMMTGAPTIETATEVARAGAADYLFKPVAREDILQAVQRAAMVMALLDERERP